MVKRGNQSQQTQVENHAYADGPKEVIEEDWSEVMAQHNYATDVETDEDGKFLHIQENDGCTTHPISSSGFATHDKIRIDLTPSRSMTLYCVQALTPLDMLDLWHGRADATGNRVWLGALFFIEVFVRRPVPSLHHCKKSDENSLQNVSCRRDMSGDDRHSSSLSSSSLLQLRRTLFHEKKNIGIGYWDWSRGSCASSCL